MLDIRASSHEAQRDLASASRTGMHQWRHFNVVVRIEISPLVDQVADSG